MRLQEIIVEGKHDPNTFKAIFMMGSPGSGKTTVARKIAEGTGLKMVNSDSVYEWLTTGTDMPIVSKGYEDELYKHSNRLVRKQMENYIDGRLGLIIDSTGKKVSRVLELKERLEKLGYETMAIFVNVDINTALDRNEERRRKVDSDWVREKHARIQQNLGQFQNIFKGRLVIVDNSEGANIDETIPHQAIRRFINRPPRMPQAKQWLGENIRLQDDYGEQMRELVNIINEQCQPWIREIGGIENFKNHPFYRGIKEEIYGAYSVRSIRTNRKPSDSPRALHDFFNKVISSVGMMASRSNAMFAWSSRFKTTAYGTTYVVVPLGDFHYTWSEMLGDWYGQILDHVNYSHIRDLNMSTNDPKVHAFAEMLADSLRGDDGTLIEAWRSQHEVMIYTKQALYIDPRAWEDLIEYYL